MHRMRSWPYLLLCVSGLAFVANSYKGIMDILPFSFLFLVGVHVLFHFCTLILADVPHSGPEILIHVHESSY